MQVREILRIKGAVLYTIAPDRLLGEAVATMTELDVGSLVVFDAGRMVGMLSFREVLSAINAAAGDWREVPVSKAMVADPLTADPEMEVDVLRRFIIEKQVRYLPIMDGQTLLGVLSFYDVAKAVLEEQSFENRMLKNYIRDWPAEEEKS